MDKNIFERLARMQLTAEEIADCMGVDMPELEEWSMKTYKLPIDKALRQQAAMTKYILRLKQFQEALRGNTSMLKFLGTQYLRQTDPVQSAKLELEAIRLEKQYAEDEREEEGEDNFMDALNAQAVEIWADYETM